MRASFPGILTLVLLLFYQCIPTVTAWGEPKGRPVSDALARKVAERQANFQDILKEALYDQLHLKSEDIEEKKVYIFSYWKPGNKLANWYIGGKHAGLLVVQFYKNSYAKVRLAHVAMKHALQVGDLVIEWQSVEATSHDVDWLKYRYLAHGIPQRQSVQGEPSWRKFMKGSAILIEWFMVDKGIELRKIHPRYNLFTNNCGTYVKWQLAALEVQYPETRELQSIPDRKDSVAVSLATDKGWPIYTEHHERPDSSNRK